MTVVASLRFAGGGGWVGEGKLIVSSRGELLVGCLLSPCPARSAMAPPTNASKAYPHYDFVISLSFFHYVYTNTTV
jgi:hypothetical protein